MKYFLPEGALSTIVTGSTISSCLLNPLPELIEYVSRQARKLFAIAISIGHLEEELQSTVENFKTHGFTDANLPIALEKDGRRLFRRWRRHDVYQFSEVQWKFLAPVFEKDIFEYSVPAQCVLPLRGVRESKTTHGAFSRVSQVVLDKDHQHGLFTVCFTINRIIKLD